MSEQSGATSQRATIGDIARHAGLSKSAVSYALNDKPGVSEETRRRVHRIAEGLGWIPNLAARALSTSRAEAIGLVLRRPAEMLGNEPFYMNFIAGIEEVVAPHETALMLHIVDGSARELAIYQHWWAQRRVDGVLLVDVTAEDERINAVQRLGIPAVGVVSSASAQGLPHLWTDDRRVMLDAIAYLLGLGHRRIARVGGIPELDHSVIRDDAFLSALADAGISRPSIIPTDFSGESGARATRALLSAPEPPTAIIYDNDIMAVAGLGAASELGVRVPRDLSIVAWDDSPVCQIAHPPLTVLKRDVSRLGAAAAEMLLTLIAGGSVSNRQAPSPVLVPRASTAPPRPTR